VLGSLHGVDLKSHSVCHILEQSHRPQVPIRQCGGTDSSTVDRFAAFRYGHPWHTGVRVAKYPKVEYPLERESVSMKKPCPESTR
jgi:hypothetical protein